jgi:hypothetical protein
VFACVAVAAVLALPGAARADLPPPGGNGGGSGAAGAGGGASPNGDDGGCAVAPSTSWSELGEGPLAAGMIGVGVAAFVWSRRRRPGK